MKYPAEGSARLIHAPAGMAFRLSTGPETTIGVKDPTTGIYPDVDLTPVDPQHSVSRRHAKIYRRGSRFFLGEEIGTMNATYVNGARLESGIVGNSSWAAGSKRQRELICTPDVEKRRLPKNVSTEQTLIGQAAHWRFDREHILDCERGREVDIDMKTIARSGAVVDGVLT